MKNRIFKITVSTLLAMTCMATANENDCFEEDPCFYEYDNRISFFVPLHLTYERIKFDAFYVGIEGWVEPVFASGSNKSFSMQWIAEAEFRLGYNYLFKGRNHATPFVGAGVIDEFRLGKKGRQVPYGVFGLLYMQEFSPTFNLGANFKGIMGRSIHKHHRRSFGSPVGGIDVSLPITFFYGSRKQWDFRSEPFDIYLHGRHHSRNYFGLRGTVGYRF